jgi:hypothetical protein
VPPREAGSFTVTRRGIIWLIVTSKVYR